uniref:Integrator complex subunit 11 n=1 Tax=Tanacetum cinerariifolium TaxID=118510 RepID=A0A6L2L5W6_TANCI|nr:integrator complex subunit 11 [Tanacetum cinerariifolium]
MKASEVIPVYNNKGDAQACSNYKGIKLLSHTMKLWERVIERRLRRESRVSENQFGFMPGRSTTEAIHLLRSLLEKYRERQKDLHMAFLDLEKAYDSVPRELVWKTLLDKGTPRRYSRVIKDMVEVAELRMLRWTCGKTMVDMISNEVFRASLDVDSIIDKIREGRLRWFGHVKRRPQSVPVRRVAAMVVDGSRRRGRPKLRWEDRLKMDMKELRLSEDMTSDRNAWRDRIRINRAALDVDSIIDKIVVLRLVAFLADRSLLWPLRSQAQVQKIRHAALNLVGKNTEDLNKKITKLNEALSDSKTMLYHYKLGLSQVKARLVEFNNQEIKFGEKIRGLEFNVKSKNNRIGRLTNELEELKKEKKGLDSKLTGFESTSKDQDTLLGSHRSDKNKEGLPEFIDDTITDYSRPSPSIESNSSDLQDSNSFVSEHGESLSSIMSKPKIKFVKAADCPRVIKNNKTETARKSLVKYAKIYRNTSKSPKVRGNQRN